MPRIGDPAPQFSLPTDGGGRVNLSDFAGKKVVLYFYPKDDTPGCTKEACDFRDNFTAVRGAGAEILGVSPDSATSHDEFKAKWGLPFPLLADEDHSVAEAYGAWKEKVLYGRTFMGIERTTILIDEHQKIAGVWNRVQPVGHAQHVLSVLKGEQPAPVPVDTTPPKPAPVKLPERSAPAKPAAAPASAPKAKPPAKAKPAAKAKPKKPLKALAKKAVKAVKKAVAKVKKKAAKPAKKAPKKGK
ncbi:MAG: thioredoxin-dependent thiol peroxidase [Deltaproteobacteria bacterium]|nr:thioredoxin-dependent thiol peroxidase [Deltaproteobacteria bacterium]